MPDEAPASNNFVCALRASAFTALIAFGLFLPLIAFKAVHDIRNELVLETRWDLFAAFVAIAFVGRLVWELTPRARVSAAAVCALIAIVARLMVVADDHVIPRLIFYVAAFSAIAFLLGAALVKEWLVAIARSPFALIACSAACAAIAGVTRSMVVAADDVVLRLISYVAGFGSVAFALGAIAAWTVTRYPVETETGRRRRHQIGVGVRAGALGFLLVYPIIMLTLTGPQGAIKWVDNFGIQILIYVMLGWGLNIVVGLAGLLDLGYVAFYAVGAYSYALLAKEFGLSFWILLPLSGILAAFWGILLGFPVLRLRGDYLAIVTLAFGEIIRLVLINWVALTNGYAGITGVPRPTLFGIPFTAADDGFAARLGIEFTPIHRTIFLYYVILLLALLTAFVTIRLRRLPIGRAWEALREDEIACRALGINTTTTKLTAFAIGAMFAGFAGSFFAARQGFISPESFTFMESAIIVAIVVLGGMGSQIGVAIAAIIMIGGTELMRELDVLKAIFGRDFDPTQYRMLLFGFAMVLIMIWKPRGLISTRQPSVYLKERKTISGAHVGEGRG